MTDAELQQHAEVAAHHSREPARGFYLAVLRLLADNAALRARLPTDMTSQACHDRGWLCDAELMRLSRVESNTSMVEVHNCELASLVAEVRERRAAELLAADPGAK